MTHQQDLRRLRNSSLDINTEIISVPPCLSELALAACMMNHSNISWNKTSSCLRSDTGVLGNDSIKVGLNFGLTSFGLCLPGGGHFAPHLLIVTFFSFCLAKGCLSSDKDVFGTSQQQTAINQ